jgi:hypothetical protein
MSMTGSWISRVAENWYWLVLIWLIVFAYGFYRNWQREKLRRKLNDAGVATMLGDQPGAGGALYSYGDAELPPTTPNRPPRDPA